MTSTNFAYWLQGFFELSYHVEVLDERETLIVKQHLDLVFKYDKQPSKFCLWLKGFLDGVDNKELTRTQTDKVKSELNSIFKHEIDPSYSSDSDFQNQMNQLHNGGKSNSGDVLVRC